MKYFIAFITAFVMVFALMTAPANAATKPYYSSASKCGKLYNNAQVCVKVYGRQAYRYAPTLTIYKVRACVEGRTSVFEKRAASVNYSFNSYTGKQIGALSYIMPDVPRAYPSCSVRKMNLSSKGKIFMEYHWKMYFDHRYDKTGKVYWRIR